MVAVVQGGIEQGAQQRWSTCIEMCLYQDNTVPVQPCIEPTRGPNKIQTRGFTRGGSYGGGGGGGCGEGGIEMDDHPTFVDGKRIAILCFYPHGIDVTTL